MNSIISNPNAPGRKTFIRFAIVFLAITVISSIYMSSELDAKPREIQGAPYNFSDLAEEAGPTVVNIRTERTISGGGRVFRHFFRGPQSDNDDMEEFFNRFFGQNNQREFKQQSLGSGFIIGKDGFIVTNNHVIEDVDKIKVILSNEKEYAAEIVGRDANTDLALIKIDPEEDLPVAKMGDSDAMRVGQWVVAIGDPFGFDHTVTAGIISAKGRDIGSGPYDDFLQTDASINPGNSGGPLLNMNGEVIGINTAITASGQGIGFAIPINLAKGIISQLKDKGEVTRGWLGVGIQDLSDELAEYYGLKEKTGVLVTTVFPGDPADKAGIKANDIILEIDGKKIEETRELISMIANTKVGESIKVKVFRDGKKKTYTVKVEKREDDQSALPGKERPEESLGISVTELTPDIVRRFNISEKEGVIVTNVRSGSKGAEADVMVRDIIKEINHVPIKSVDDYNEAIDGIKKGESIQMYVRRGNGYLIIKMEK